MSEPLPEGLVLGADDGPTTAWVDARRGSVAFRAQFDSGLTPCTTLTTGVAELGEGGRFHVHRHTPAEVYLILEGDGVMSLGSAEHRVTAGSSIWIPSRVWHGIRNVGDTVLRFHYVLDVASLADVDYDYDAPS